MLPWLIPLQSSWPPHWPLSNPHMLLPQALAHAIPSTQNALAWLLSLLKPQFKWHLLQEIFPACPERSMPNLTSPSLPTSWLHYTFICILVYHLSLLQTLTLPENRTVTTSVSFIAVSHCPEQSLAHGSCSVNVCAMNVG